MTANSPQQRLRVRAKKRWTSPQFLNGMALFIVAGGLGIAMTVYIQEKYDLYTTSSTMSLIGTATAIVMLLVIFLLGRRRYVWAWACALLIPPVVFLFALHVLERNPPIAPMG